MKENWRVIAILSSFLLALTIFIYLVHSTNAAQAVASEPTVSNCNTTSQITVCTLTDPSHVGRQWLIVEGPSGIAVVEDDVK